ncbi:MAG: peptidylprolyl isomerase [Oscillospiraceae bacterium]|nr:peptidylprolyl isomerase [Oscillospiraceae bacterium]
MKTRTFKTLLAAAAASMLLLTGCVMKKDDITDGISVIDEQSTPSVGDNDELKDGITDKDKQSKSSVGNIGELTLCKGDLIAVFDIKDYGKIKAKLFPDIAPIGVDNFRQLANIGYYDGKNIHRVMPNFMMQGGSLNGDGTGGNAVVSGGVFGIETDTEKACHFYGALCYANAGGMNSTQFYIVNNKEPQDISAMTEYYAQNMREAQRLVEKASEEAEKQYYQSYADYFAQVVEQFGNITEEAEAKYAKVGGTPSLDGSYTVFGQVYNGFDVIDAIAAVELTENAGGELSSPKKEIIINSVKVIEFEG